MRTIINVILLLSIIAIVAYGVLKTPDSDTLSASDNLPIGYQSARTEILDEMKSLPDTATLVAEDYQRLADLGSGVLDVTYDSLSDDDGVTHAKDVKITLAGKPETGIAIEALTIWGADVDGIAALIAGDLATEVRIADRFEATGIKIFGVEEIYQHFNDKTTEMMVEAMDEATDGAMSEALEDEDLYTEIGKYEFYTGSFVLEGFTYHGIANAQDFQTIETPWDAFAALAKLHRSMSYDLAAYTDIVSDMDMTDANMEMSMSAEQPMVAISGYRRGDMDFVIYDGIEISTTVNSDEFPEGMTIDFALDGATISGMKLAEFLGYIENRTLPPMDQTDIISAGKFNFYGFSYGLNGSDFYSVGKFDMDLTQFHWLFPKKITVTVNNEVIDFNALANFVLPLMEAGASAEGTDAELETMNEMKEVVTYVLSTLKSYDLDRLIFDSEFIFEWSPETGATDLSMVSDFSGFSVTTLDMRGVLPNYADAQNIAAIKPNDAAMSGISDLDGTTNDIAEDAAEDIADEMTDTLDVLSDDLSDDEMNSWTEYEPDPRMQALHEAFMGKLALSWAKLSITDMGGVDKSFGIAVDLSKYIPESEDMPQVQMLKNSDPKQLKDGVAALVRLGAGAVGSEFPPATQYLTAFSDFLLQSGTYTVALMPDEPISAATMAQFQSVNGAPPSPEAIVDTLGLEITHTPPAE